MEELLLKYGLPTATPVLIGLVAWLLKRDLKRGDKERSVANTQLHNKLDEQSKTLKQVNGRMDCFEKAQHACQLDNAKSFATKGDVTQLWETVDEHSKDIAKMKGAREHQRG